MLINQSSLFGYGTPCQIKVQFQKIEGRKHATMKDRNGTTYKAPVYQDGEDVRGTVSISLNKGKKLDHMGVRIELTGVIENLYDKTQNSTFLQLVRDLEPPGSLTDDMTYDFQFNRVEKQFESYNGIVVKVRYYLNVVVNRSYGKITKEEEFIVQNLGEEPAINPPIKMEVGIEECLHIEFEFAFSKFHLKDCIVGKVNFNLVRIKIKLMELSIIRRETVGSGQSAVSENEVLTKFELMDGAPVKGELVPIRFFLASTDLTPSYKNVNNRFSCKYILNLVLIDEEDRRYFKQQDIELWRKKV